MRDLLKKLRTDPEVFFSGRELVGIASVVILTVLAGMLSSVTGPVIPHGDYLTRLLWFPTKPSFSATYRFLMPILLVLWFAQLLPKFAAQASPIRSLGAPLTQPMVKLSSFFGGVLEIGAPSVWLKRVLGKINLESVADELGPSRDAHYKSSAILRYGRGLELFRKRLEIGEGGKIHSTTEIVYRAFKTEFNREYAFNEWWLASVTEVAYEIIKKPDGCEISAKRVFSDARREDGTAVERGVINLRFGLTKSVPVGKTFEYKINCVTAPNATAHEFGSKDYYVHKITVPTKKMVFEIVPAVATSFLVMNGTCKSELSNEPQANDDESRRVLITNGYEQRGCRFEIDYLLEGTELRFDWVIEEQAASKG